MNKIKSVKKAKKSYIKIKSEKGQNLLESKIHSINNADTNCMLKINIEGDSKKFSIVYDTNGFISLREYLSMPLTLKTFSSLLNNILCNLEIMKKSFWDYQKVLFNVDFVMINPSYRTVHFAFVPIEPFENKYDLREMLCDIVKIGSFDRHEDSSYIDDYISTLNKGMGFSSFELEEFIKKINAKKTNYSSFSVCTYCGAHIPENMQYCEICGENLNFESTAKQRTEYKHILKEKSNRSGTINRFFLIREKNGEKIEICPPRTVIGKDPLNCNYSIKDNPSVSRIHASFYVREGHLFVEDQGSTNFTFIDSKALDPKNPHEIFSGTRILLANEVFWVESENITAV